MLYRAFWLFIAGGSPQYPKTTIWISNSEHIQISEYIFISGMEKPSYSTFKNSPLFPKKLEWLVRPVSSTSSRTEDWKLNRSNAMMLHKGVNLGNNTTISWTLPKMIHSMRPVTQPIRNTNQHTVNNLHAHIASLFCYLLLLLARGKNPIKCNHTSSESKKRFY